MVFSMSPKVDSRASEPARPAWSRDVRPNTSSVTYSRRSYYYDDEFSDSITTPADDFIHSVAVAVVAKKSDALRAYEDPFTRGRVLQSAASASASDSDEEEDGGGDIPNSVVAIEMRDCVPVTQAQSQAPPHQPRSAPTDSEDGAGLVTAHLDMLTMAQTFIVAMDLAARITDVFQRFRGSEVREGGVGGVDERLPDPYYLETGLLPPRYRSPSRASSSSSSRSRSLPTGLRKSTSQRPVTISSASTSTSLGSTPDEPQGHAADGNTTAAVQTGALLNPLPPMKRLCYYLVATALFGVLASFGFALWWARSRGDVSAGFTIGGYLIAVDALVVAVVGIVHRPGCRCWKA